MMQNHTTTRADSVVSVPSVVNVFRSRGSAMTETVLVLPLIFVVLALLFFFGQAMTRWQRSSVTDRYEVWRQAQYAPGPGVTFEKHSRSFGDGVLLDEAFFAGNTHRLDVAGRAGRINVQQPTDLIAEETQAIASSSSRQGYDPTSAEDYVRELHLRTPAWWRIDLATEHTSTVQFYQRFAGAVRHQSTVIDGDWTFAFWLEQEHRGVRSEVHDVLEDVHLVSAPDSDNHRDLYDYRPYSINGIYPTYYSDIDAVLLDMEQQDNPLARAIRGIYMMTPDYLGPQVLPEISPRYVRLVISNNPDPGSAP